MDSPLSDDSLSSVGASTEPLPASEGPILDSPQLNFFSKQTKSSQLAGGEESDSSLTEQSDSDGEQRRSRDAVQDDDDPTPKANKVSKSGKGGKIRKSAPNLSDTEQDNQDDANSLASFSGTTKNKRVKLSNSGKLNEIDTKSATAKNSAGRPAGKRNALASTRATKGRRTASGSSRATNTTGMQVETLVATTSNRGGSKGRGRGRGKGKTTALSRKQAAAAAAAAAAMEAETEATESPQPEVDVKDEEEISSAVLDRSRSSSVDSQQSETSSRGEKRNLREMLSGEEDAREEPQEDEQDSQQPTPSQLDDEDQNGEAEETADEMQLDAEIEQSEEENFVTAEQEMEANRSGFDAVMSAVLAQESAEQATEAEAAAREDEKDETEPEAEDDDDDDEDDEPPIPIEPKKKGHLAQKKGKKPKGKGKQVEPLEENDSGIKIVIEDGDEAGDDVIAEPSEDEAEEEEEEEIVDDAAIRLRTEAMESLTLIEIQFAQLRDSLYLQRIKEVETERYAVESQQHPDLKHLTNLIEARRNSKLSLAKKWLESLELIYERHRASTEHTQWSLWTNSRNDLRTKMLNEANSKRRKLVREKGILDRPKDESLIPLLMPRPAPVVPLQHRRRLGFDGEGLTENDIAWALRHPDVSRDAAVTVLDDESALSDLQQLGLREPPPIPAGYTYGNLGYNMLGGATAPFDQRGASVTAFGFPPQPNFDSIPQQVYTTSQANLPTFQPTQASQPLSNNPLSAPRTNSFQKENSFGSIAPGTNHARTYSGNQFGFGAHRPDENLLGPRSQLGATAAEEGRRRTTSTGGESLDLYAEHHARRATEEGSVQSSTKNIISLDDHMKHSRSPKQSFQPHPTNSNLTANSKNSSNHSAKNSNFAPLTIPPFNPNRFREREQQNKVVNSAASSAFSGVEQVQITPAVTRAVS